MPRTLIPLKPDSKLFDRTLLLGLEEIAMYLRVKPTTVRRWYRKHALPLAKTPAGVTLTSTELIDQWIMARHRVQVARDAEMGKAL